MHADERLPRDIIIIVVGEVFIITNACGGEVHPIGRDRPASLDVALHSCVYGGGGVLGPVIYLLVLQDHRAIIGEGKSHREGKTMAITSGCDLDIYGLSAPEEISLVTRLRVEVTENLGHLHAESSLVEVFYVTCIRVLGQGGQSLFGRLAELVDGKSFRYPVLVSHDKDLGEFLLPGQVRDADVGVFVAPSSSGMTPVVTPIPSIAIPSALVRLASPATTPGAPAALVGLASIATAPAALARLASLATTLARLATPAAAPSSAMSSTMSSVPSSIMTSTMSPIIIIVMARAGVVTPSSARFPATLVRLAAKATTVSTPSSTPAALAGLGLLELAFFLAEFLTLFFG
mmetsp:Transcript_38622/g.93009  ORF Transcript_38622/g.93009 Transcript_38622/m.93009 type:complete len:347 (+) Transcript_38622:775-1815(+)